jgi:CubicO group peptidase (beta-lactamase class C family)
VVAATGPAVTQDYASGMSQERLERVTGVLDKHVAAGNLSGAVSLVYRHGEIAHLSARGLQDIEAKTPMQRDTIFGLASMTKPITAVATMILVEEGKMRLDEPIDRWIPELADRKVLNDPAGPLDEVHDSPRPITVRDLLRYTMGTGAAGFSGVAPDAPIAAALAAQRGGGEITVDEYLKRLGALPLMYPPGEHFVYNTASDVAGALIARVSGMGLDRFFETRIFEPLGMTDTGFWVPPAKRARLATSYRGGSGTLVPMARSTRYMEPPAFPSGAAGLVSTVDDYLAFARMLLNEGEVDGVRMLSRKSVELMTTDQLTKDRPSVCWVARPFGAGRGLDLVSW